MELQVNPFPLFTHLSKPWSELWVTLPATCPALGTGGETPFFGALAKWQL